VAIAHTIVNNPKIVLTNEPTGNLDSKRGEEIMRLLSSLNRDRHITVIMVTHDARCAAYAPRQVVFRDGGIVSDSTSVPSP
jgi:putative ABC transport system ATP-binding protein